MTTFTNLAERWLDWAIAATWQVSLFVCAIAAIGLALRGASARLRYGLWLLVLVKALLPPSLAADWAVGRWAGSAVEPWIPMAPRPAAEERGPSAGASDGVVVAAPVEAGGAARETFRHELLFIVWAAGCAAIWIAVAGRYVRLARSTIAMRAIDEGSLRVELERIAHRLGVRASFDLYATTDAISPMLFGLWRPRIVIPENIVDDFSASELRMILSHELMHWRRRDVWVGWVQVLVQGLFWFHPFVWAANARIRHERECACDEAVLRTMPGKRDDYGQTIVRVLTAARGRSLAMDHLAGVFERGSRLQLRLEEIMSFDPNRRKFGWLSRAAVLGAAALLLPMATPAQEGESNADSLAAARDENGSAEAERQRVADSSSQPPSSEPKTNWPTIVATVPAVGATDVDPALDEISVTFDRDMDASGLSWTGGGPAYPPSPDRAQPYWKDKRTCVLPVELKHGAFYRVGINSSSFQNFRSELGEPAETTAIYFATRGASRSVVSRVREPKAIRISPEPGADDVDPRLGVISVTFNVPMDPNGFSWTGGGPTFPKVPEGQRPRWSRDGKICTLPVELAPGTTYELGLNSVSHKNFASRWGVPLAPVRLRFTTAGDRVDDAPDKDDGGIPRIVKMIPENGATDVNPALTEIIVSFDRPMGGGFSWTGGGEHFPTIPEGQRPQWSSDKQTCAFPVVLKPRWTYRLGLNSPSHKNFSSAEGVPLEPIVYEFRTGVGEE